MSGLSNTQKQDFAKSLYLNDNLTHQEIADRVGVTRLTVRRWAEKGNWKELKASLTITKEVQLKSLYNQLAEINKTISERKESRFANDQEIKIISKLADAIKKMEGDIGIADIVSVGKRFSSFLKKISLEKAKELTGLYDMFIKDSLQ